VSPRCILCVLQMDAPCSPCVPSVSSRCTLCFPQVYVSQTLFKLLASALIVSLSAPLLGSMSFSHVCHPGDEGSLVGYGTFQCAHTLASLLHKLLLAYLLLLASYGLLNLYALAWIAHRCSCSSYSLSLSSSSSSSS